MLHKRLRRFLAYFVLSGGLVLFAVFVSNRLGLGHTPQHEFGYVTWWLPDGRIGGTVKVPTSSQSVPLLMAFAERETTFENSDHRLTYSSRFLRNAGRIDIYRFYIELDDQSQAHVDVGYDGNHAAVFRDTDTGIALTVESDRSPPSSSTNHPMNASR